jgi:hypothetical protein
VSSEFTDNEFTKYDGWTISPDVLEAYTDCNDYGRVFGGFGKFGERKEVYKAYNLQNIPHYGLYVTMKFLKIDSWDPSDGVDIFIDNINKQRITSTAEDGPSHQCGTTDGGLIAFYISHNERMFPLSFSIIPHTSNSLEIKFISSFDEDLSNESWGIREIYIYLNMCDTTCLSCSGPLATDCLTCQINFFQINKLCICRDYFYQKETTNPLCESNQCSICNRCDISCKSCDGPAITNCLSCEKLDIFSEGNKTCNYPLSKCSCLPYN